MTDLSCAVIKTQDDEQALQEELQRLRSACRQAENDLSKSSKLAKNLRKQKRRVVKDELTGRASA